MTYLKLIYLGHSAVMIEEGKFKGIIDPFITENSLTKINSSDLLNVL